MPSSSDENSQNESDSPTQPDSGQSDVPVTHETPDTSELMIDPDATVDSVPASSESHESEVQVVATDAVDPGETYIPKGESQSKINEWEASISDDADPGQTLKSKAAGANSTDRPMDQTASLKHRSVSRHDASDGESGTTDDSQPDYQTEELLGEGGMGAVFAARQQSMDRPVAIKVLKPRAARLEGSRRAFVSEAVITGGLDHPNIVPIYDVAKQADEALFYAMKRVEGVEWKDRLAGNSVASNLAILIRVADAIAFAHDRCIIHRDLKPANIMLGAFGEVLVMDWGLAMPSKDHPRRESFPRAKRGGTPHYMAPEMADDPMEGVDYRSDVYLLGAILFEIVTGKAPHAFESPSGSRRSRVKACLAAVAENAIVSTNESGELIEIARKAMATDPDDRYQTVKDFQTALVDHLGHEKSIELANKATEALDAARQSGEYEKFSRARFGFETAFDQWPQNTQAAEGLKETRTAYAQTAYERGDFDLALSLLDDADADQVALITTIQAAAYERDSRTKRIRRLRQFSIVTSLTIAVLASGAAVWIDAERDSALIAQQDEAVQRGVAEAQRKNAIDAQLKAEANEEKAVAAEAEANRNAEDARRSLKIAERNAYNSDMLLVQREWEQRHVHQTASLLDRYVERKDLVGFEWGYWIHRLNKSLLKLEGHGHWVRSASFSPDGKKLASVGGFHTDHPEHVIVWDLVSGKQVTSFEAHSKGITSVAFSPDGMRLVTGSEDKTVRVWDADSGNELIPPIVHKYTVYGVSFSPDGSRVATASTGDIRIIDAATGEQEMVLSGHRSQVFDVEYSSDGKRVATAGGYDKTVRIWDALSGQELMSLNGHSDLIWSVAFNKDGSRVASTSNDRTVKVWDAVAGTELLSLTGHEDAVKDVSFSPDGKQLASASSDKTVRIWNSTSGAEVATLNGHASSVVSVAFSPDGERLASTSGDQTIRVWDAIGNPGPLIFSEHSDWLSSVAFNSDGTLVASASGTLGFPGEIRIWDSASGRELLELSPGKHRSQVFDVAFAPQGKYLAAAVYDGTIRIWSTDTGIEEAALEGHESIVTDVAYSHDGTRLASASQDNTVKVWDVSAEEELLTLAGHTDKVACVSFNSDGTQLASASYDNSVKIWDMADGSELLALNGHTFWVLSLSYSPDGQRLASAGWDEIKVWDANSGTELLTLEGHNGKVTSVEFSPDGNRLSSASEDGTVKVWDSVTGRELLSLAGHDSAVTSISFSPDGLRLASAGRDKTVKVWDARPWTQALRSEQRARSLLKARRNRFLSLERLQENIAADQTIGDLVRSKANELSSEYWSARRGTPSFWDFLKGGSPRNR